MLEGFLHNACIIQGVSSGLFLYIGCVRVWGRSAELSTVGINRNRHFIEGIVFYLFLLYRSMVFWEGGGGGFLLVN